MARVRFAQGVHYLIGGEVYRVRRVLPGDRLIVENIASGADIVVSQVDLRLAWAHAELLFEVRGMDKRGDVDDTPTVCAGTDLAGIPSDLRAEAWRRYRLILPLVDLPPRERSRRAIEEYAAKLPPPVATRASLERWLHAFLGSGRDIRSLVPATGRRGGKGQVRLDADVERIVGQVLAACAASPAYRTTDDVYLMVLNRMADENRHRAPAERLKPPGRNTVHRRIVAAGSDSILRRRRSRAERRAESAVSEGPRLTHVLERVEIDHTLLDLFLVDEEDRLPIGRPTLTLAIDVYSRMPFGLFVSFEPPSYRAVMGCLLHGILPKPDAHELYGTDNDWPVWGLPEKLVTDNGREFVGRDLEDACGQLGITLDPNPPRMPWYKGAVERFVRMHNTGLVHALPGTTYSNLRERGDYDPARHACLSLPAFTKLLHIWLLDVYAHSWHDGAKAIPARRWAESVAAGWEPALHHDSAEVRILLSRTAERTIQRTGIDFESLRYQTPDLARLRSVLPAGAKVRIKYDPGDVGAIHVYDATAGGRWLRVPALDRGYAAGLSLRKHRAIRRVVLAEKGEVDIEALAAAKARIRRIAEDEYGRTRGARGRKTAARLLNTGRAAPPGRMEAPPAPRPFGELPGCTDGRDAEMGAGESDLTGWGGDYGLDPRIG